MSYTQHEFSDEVENILEATEAFKEAMTDLSDSFVSTAQSIESLSKIMRSIHQSRLSPGDFVRARYKGRKGPVCKVLSVPESVPKDYVGWNFRVKVLILHSNSITSAPQEWFEPLTPLETLALQAS